MSESIDPYSPRMSVAELERQAIQVRLDILEMIYVAQAGHPGGSLSAADILTALYFRMMRVDPQSSPMARPRPVYFIQGPCLPGMVCRTGEPGIF